jgi:hypothetical protein
MALKSKPLKQVRQNLPVQIVTQEDLVRINLNVPKSIRSRWKIEAAKRDVTLTDLILDAMKKYSGE